MKKAYLLLLIVLTAGTLCAQEGTLSQKQRFAVQSKLEITEEINCADIVLVLVLKLSFTNLGEKNVIVSKTKPLMDSYSIYSVLSDKTEKRILYSRSDYTLMEFNGNYDSPDPKRFAILKTNDTLEIRNMLQSVYPLGTKYGMGLKDGKYTAHFNFVMFPFYTNPSRLNWNQYGTLLTGFSPITLDFSIDSEKMKQMPRKSEEACADLSEKLPVVKACIITKDGTECDK